MRLRLGRLRALVREALAEAYPLPHVAPSPASTDRESLDSLARSSKDKAGKDEELPAHLQDPVEDPEDCYGPVPPDDKNQPYVTSDPYAKGYNVLPQPRR